MTERKGVYQSKSSRLSWAYALCQSVDSVMSGNATDASVEAAVDSICLLLDNAVQFLRGEGKATEAVSEGQFLAERAESISGNTISKRLAEALSKKYLISYEEAFVLVAPYVCDAQVRYLVDTCGFRGKNLPDQPDMDSLPSTDDNNMRVLADRLEILRSVISPAESEYMSLKPQFEFNLEIMCVELPGYSDLADLQAFATESGVSSGANDFIIYTDEQLGDILLRSVHMIRGEVLRDEIEKYDPNHKMLQEEYYKTMSSQKGVVENPFNKRRNERFEFVNSFQHLTLETLLLSQKFLDQYNLRFYLAEGSLLGAVRHHGFIPWDDDIDIVMPRDDYNRLVELAAQGKVPPELNFDSLENNPKHWVLGAKLQLTRPTKYIQKKVIPLSKCCGPYVDIFPLDYWDAQFNKKQYYADRMVKMCRRLLFMNTGYNKRIRKKPHFLVMRIMCLFLKNEWIEKFAIKNMTKFHNGKRKFMVNLCSYYRFYKEVFPTGFFGEPVMMEFEGHPFPVPREYDYMLKIIYGPKYDSIPPVKVTRSRQHAFEIDESFREEEDENYEE